MKVLVTGATGFIGGALAYKLKNLQMEVTALGRNKEKGKLLEKAGISFIAIDLTDAKEIIKVCQQQDMVFHSGAFSSPWGKYQDFFNANVTGTKNVIVGCLEHQVKRLVYISSPSIYFNFRNRFGVREDDPLPQRQANAYSQTKLLAEECIDKAYQQGLKVISIRPRAVFGPGDNAILPRIIGALEENRLPLIGATNNVIDITYIDNVISALILCMDSPANTLGKKYNITNGSPVELWPLIYSLLKYRKILSEGNK